MESGDRQLQFLRCMTEDVPQLSKLAAGIVREHFDPIIGTAQNDYMIERFQSEEAIREQMAHGYQYYYVLNGEGERIGFLAFYRRNEELYLSKFYLRKEFRGQGLSWEMLRFVVLSARKMGLPVITLNVNRGNDAIFAYESMGFQRIRGEVSDIGGGFVMDDYVYQYVVDDSTDCGG